LYIGVIVSPNGIEDVMVYNSCQECVDNLVDAVGVTHKVQDAKVFEHTDSEDGDQTLDIVWDFFKPTPVEVQG
jgi:hypothetical protein